MVTIPCSTGFSISVEKQNQDNSTSLPTNFLTNLMQSMFKHVCNDGCDNISTSLDHSLLVVEQKCCVVGTVEQYHKELSQAAKIINFSK